MQERDQSCDGAVNKRWKTLKLVKLSKRLTIYGFFAKLYEFRETRDFL